MGRLAWAAMLFFATAIAVVSSRYLVGGVSFEAQRGVYEAHPVLLFCHVGGGITALCVGPWQFRAGLRAARPRLHRWLGRVYLTAIGIGAFGGFGLAPMAHGGWPAGIGFALLACSWLFTSVAALRAILARRVEDHRHWMMRSYACTFAAVTLRAWLPLLQIVGGMEFTAAYITVAWISWVPNLAVAELMIRARTRRAQPTREPAAARA